MTARLGGALVFLTSGVVLILEILAGRMLAPYAGVTLETFTAIIGVVLAGIAFGTWLGGRLADGDHDPVRLLGPTLVLGGGLAAMSVPVVAVLGPGIGREGIPGLMTLTAVAMLPSTSVLSSASPMVVKAILTDLDVTGRTVGRISALGTAGALVGTFTSGFLLVAAAPTSTIIVGVSSVTVAVGVGLVLWARTPRRPGLTAVIVAAVALTVAAGSTRAPCDVETAYFCASDVADPDRPTGSFLVLDTITHAYVDRDDPTHLRFSSTRMFVAAIEAMSQGPIDAVHIGGGGFSVPSWVAATRPGSRNVVLELDGELIEFVERTYDPAPVDRVIVGDARLGLEQTRGGFDVAVGDAFGGLAVPWHLTTKEFLEDVRASLDHDGFYIMNTIDHGDLDFIRAELATARAVFPHVALVTVDGRLERGGNFMIVGSLTPIPDAAIVAEGAQLDLDLVALTGRTLDGLIGDAAVLTDDYAPVDQLLETA